MLDIDAYLTRIAYTGPRTPTLETLTALHALHPAAIPFENLNPLLGWPAPLDLDSLQIKMVAGQRGGWCFEHNTLFGEMLRALGFQVTNLGARVLWNAKPGAPIGSRSHMLLKVDAGGQSYLADVGFGGNVLTSPLLLQPGFNQATPHEPHRLVEQDGALILEMLAGEAWMPLYRFTLEPQFPSDYEVSSFYLCHHPSSFFRQMLIAARTLPAERRMLRNNLFTVRRGAHVEQQLISEAAALRGTLEQTFGIAVPDTVEVNAMLERVSRLEAAT